MKKLLMFGLASVLVMGTGTTCLAGPYFNGNLAAVIAHDSDGDFFGVPIEIESDTGYGLSLAIGNDLTDYRFEAELAYRNNDLDKMTVFIVPPVSGSIDGEVTSTALMGNVYWDLNTGTVVTPFIGAGIGVANVDAEITGLGDGDDTVFAYQLALGLAFKVSEAAKIDLSYRYFATSDPDLDGVEIEYDTSNIMVGFRTNF